MDVKKLVLIAFLAAFVSGTTAPTLTKVLGFNHAAYAQDDDNQGDENDDTQ
jgi:hypothetical protein